MVILVVFLDFVYKIKLKTIIKVKKLQDFTCKSNQGINIHLKYTSQTKIFVYHLFYPNTLKAISRFGGDG